MGCPTYFEKNYKYLTQKQIEYLRTKTDKLPHYEQVLYKKLYPGDVQKRMFIKI